MKTIQHPNSKQVSYALIPIYILCAYVIISHSIQTWVYIVGAISFITYFALVTFFCIKQKCYQQLILNYAFGALFALIFYLQFHAIDMFFKD